MRRLLSLALLLGLAGPALADKKEFEAHKKKATIHYELAEYDKAIEEYKAAYAISQEIWILYNIAQAYRLGDNCAMAARFYKNYVTAAMRGKDPAPERTKHAQEQLPLMEKCAAEAPPPSSSGAGGGGTGATGTTTPTPTSPPPVDEPNKDPGNAAISEPSSPEPQDGAPVEVEPTPTDEEPATPGRWMRIAGLSLVGGGAVLVGAGIVFNLQALDKEKELESRYRSEDPMAWDQEAQDLYSDMDSLKTRAVVFYVIGGAFLAGGGVLTYLGFTQPSAEAVAVTPLPGGAMVSTELSF